MTASSPEATQQALEQNSTWTYTVYKCEECGKYKPNPYVVFPYGFECECSEATQQAAEQASGGHKMLAHCDVCGRDVNGNMRGEPYKHLGNDGVLCAGAYRSAEASAPRAKPVVVCPNCDELRSQLENERLSYLRTTKLWEQTRTRIVELDEELAETRGIAVTLYGALEALRNACIAEPSMNGRKYVGLGIQVNSALNKWKAAGISPLAAQEKAVTQEEKV